MPTPFEPALHCSCHHAQADDDEILIGRSLICPRGGRGTDAVNGAASEALPTVVVTVAPAARIRARHRRFGPAQER